MDERRIRALLRAREFAVADGDADAVVASLASEVVVYDLQLPLECGGSIIVHEHSSFPMIMDGSDRVASDLRPA